MIGKEACAVLCGEAFAGELAPLSPHFGAKRGLKQLHLNRIQEPARVAPRFGAKRGLKHVDGHADRFWSRDLHLCAKGARMNFMSWLPGTQSA